MFLILEENFFFLTEGDIVTHGNVMRIKSEQYKNNVKRKFCAVNMTRMKSECYDEKATVLREKHWKTKLPYFLNYKAHLQ